MGFLRDERKGWFELWRDLAAYEHHFSEWRRGGEVWVSGEGREFVEGGLCEVGLCVGGEDGVVG